MLPSIDSPYYRNASLTEGQVFAKWAIMKVVGLTSNTITSDDINSIDVLAHEMTHGVTYFIAGLVYSGESGALKRIILRYFWN
ncbi:MAG: hypothetical protein IPN26_11655 [Bacteroidetes bacterium]|nr:hypothetical protein [Bacteroidota bacterium]